MTTESNTHYLIYAEVHDLNTHQVRIMASGIVDSKGLEDLFPSGKVESPYRLVSLPHNPSNLQNLSKTFLGSLAEPSRYETVPSMEQDEVQRLARLSLRSQQRRTIPEMLEFPLQ